MTTRAPFTDERRRALEQLGASVPLVPGLISRWLAFLLDIAVMMLAAVASTYLIEWTGEFFRLDKFPIGHRIVDVTSRVTVLLVWLLYFPLSWTLTGQSVGKAILGLRVVRSDPRHPSETKLSLPRCYLRVAGYWLSALPFGLGFLTAVFNAEHRTLHDRIAGTRVVYQPSQRSKYRRG